MQTIFVQVKCEMGQAYDVAQGIVELDGVSEVFSTSGHYDLLVKCFLPGNQDAGHFVTDKIQRVKGVQDTHTTITFNAFS